MGKSKHNAWASLWWNASHHRASSDATETLICSGLMGKSRFICRLHLFLILPYHFPIIYPKPVIVFLPPPPPHATSLSVLLQLCFLQQTHIVTQLTLRDLHLFPGGIAHTLALSFWWICWLLSEVASTQMHSENSHPHCTFQSLPWDTRVDHSVLPGE